jgi:hypothetical protein
MTITTISNSVSHGILLGASNYGLSLTVASTGAVNGGGYAIYGPISVSNEALVNDGLIAAARYGVFLGSPGSLLNAGSISGGNVGAFIAGSNPSFVYNPPRGNNYFTNTGRISGGTYGVYLSFVTASNAGTIAGGKTGLRMSGASLVNSNSISGGTIGLAIEQGVVNNTGSGRISSQLVGVFADSVNNNDLPIINAGNIYGGNTGAYINDGTLTNTGTIGAGTIGVWLTASNGTNSGLIHGNAIGVYLYSPANGKYFTNEATGTIASSAGIGLSAADTRYVVNNGLITGKAAGVYVADTPFANTGIVNGGSVGVAVFNAVVNDTGTITGGTFAIEAESAFILNITNTAVLNGNVLDLSGTGGLNVAGSGPGTLSGLGTKFIGFSNIGFAPDWTLQGNAAGLAAGQVINGFTTTDVLILDGFAASSSSISTAGLVLTDGIITETIDLTAIPAVSDLTITSNGVNTTIACAQPIPPLSIISTFDPVTLTPGLNNIADSLTITSTGYVTGIQTGFYNQKTVTNYGSINTVNFSAYSTLLNFGVIAGTVGVTAGDFDSNAGTIIGTGSNGIGVNLRSVFETLVNSGVIASDGTAVYANIEDHIFNTGSIHGNVIFKDYNYLVNSGVISGRSTFGIDALQGYIQNSGTITGPEIGIAEGDAGGTIVNTGTITGSAYGISLAGGTIIDSGLISGATDAIFNNDRPPYSFSLITLSLEVNPGASFAGAVYDESNEGILLLGGSTAGALDMGTSFSGFSNISFDSGSDWRLEGAASNLAGGQIITGFSFGDTIILDSFTVNPLDTSYVTGAGLHLTDTSGHHVTLDIAGNFSTSSFIVTDPSGYNMIVEAICYLRGTSIATPAGEIPVESLNIGDAVITRFNGYRKIKWIGRQSFARRFVENDFDQIPVRITAGALGAGVPRRDLFISPGHSMLIDNVLVLASSLVNGITITQDWAPEEIQYYQIEFETHDCVLAEGAWSESYADTPDFRARFHNAAEFYALYPNHVEPAQQTLCAPRPLAGPALAAALTPLVQRAAAKPGRLHGYIDNIANATIRGWAWDESNPHLPVQLEILLRNQLIGRILACDYRADLAAAGYGHGRCSFEFSSPLGLPRNAARSLRIRRAQDRAEIFCSDSFRATAPPIAA